MPQPLPVLVNPLSGGGFTPEDRSRIEGLFRDAGAEPAFRLSSDVRAAAQSLAQERPPCIVAAGGDGSVSAVASALVGTDVALAVLPTGTLNHFARDLGLPGDLGECVRAAVAGKTHRVDVGDVNGRIFVNNASIGLYPAIVRRRERQQRQLGRGKWHAMLWAVHTVLRGHPFLNLTLELDGVTQRRRTPFVFVGNNEYQMEGFTMGTRSTLDGGALSIYMSHRRGRIGLLLLALRALFGRLQQAKDFEAASVSELRIDSRHARLLVATDGEVSALDMPLHFRIRPRALRVVVP
jgi:diacylglycerol kinase family enzyme